MPLGLEQLRDSGVETRIHSARVSTALALVLLAFGALIARYYQLQVSEFQSYQTQADRNRVRLEPIAPKRGLITDRRGALLALNEPTFALGVVVERADDLVALLDDIDQLLGLSEEERTRFQQLRRHRRPWSSVTLKTRLTEAEIATVSVNRYRLPGTTLDAQLTRYYPEGDSLAHVLGYVGRISEQEEAEIDQSLYQRTLHIGKVGLEKYYEAALLGRPGYQNIETNAHGRILRVLDQQAPIDGADIELSLDLALQRVASEALGEQRGAVVALDPRDGGILALVSNPSFNNNLFVEGIGVRDYAALRDSPDLPLLNRVIQGQYPPGSTVKPMIGLAGLELGVIDAQTTIPDPGWYQLPGDERRYRDWVLRIRGTGHADRVGLRMAIAQSCDVFYYELARRLGVDSIAQFMAPFGFGDKTGVDLPSERSGLLSSSDWKRRAYGQPWYPGETLNIGIGQGYTLATPMQLALATMVVANRGESFVPSLVRRIGDRKVTAEPRPLVQATAEHWQEVVSGMVDVVHTARGTAAAVGRGLDFKVAGKTGTSQVISIAQDAVYDETEIDERHRNHGWFVAFAPEEAPEIVVVVLAENGGGSSAAYPVAGAVLRHWWATRDV